MRRGKKNGEALRESLFSDKLSFAFLMTAFGMLIVFAFIHNPEAYTISRIGTEHPMLFFLTCTIMSVATATNMFRLFESSGVRSRWLTVLTYAANAAMILASFTMTEEYVRGLTELHWTAALMFMGINPLLILICAVRRVRRGNRRCIGALIIFPPIYCADILYILRSFLSLGAMDSKNGVMELIPILSTFLLLFLFNHTKLLEEQ